MFDTLTDKLQDTIQGLRGEKTITEDNVKSAITEVRRSLLESDVSLKAVKLFTTRVQDKALGAEVLTGVKPGEQIIKIINDALIEILGGEAEELQLAEVSAGETNSILLLGLQGAGKTTAAAKLAFKLKSEGKKPLLVPCDLQRPAAIQQLRVLAGQAEVDFLDVEIDKDKKQVKNLLDLAKLAKEYSKENEIHTIIYDTAGRLQVDTELMAELLLLEKSIKPSEKLLVIDSLIGQEAVNVAETFDTQIGITGVILTKLDGDAKGGAALSVVEATQKPIKLASVGEKLEDLEKFHPDRMASRILGMGDVVSLVEKAQEKFDEKEAKRLEEELLKGNFNYETFVAAQNMMGKLGSMSSIFKMMGMGGILSQFGLKSGDQEALMEQGESKMSKFKIAINSMTKKEKRDPALMNLSRKRRIAKGSGLSEQDIDQLVAEFTKMKQVFGNLGPMLGAMQGMGGGMGVSPDAGSGAEPDSKLVPQGGMNPMDMLGAAMSKGMSKRQKQAMKQMGGMTGMGAMGAPAKKSKKAKKGEKPQIKGFGDR